MRATFVDVENEFTEIAREADFLGRTLAASQARRPLPGSHGEWEMTHVCASAIEKIYTGCERMMARIASEVDGSALSHSEGWHSALLRRMANPFPDVRDAVISPECLKQMDRLRAFRHRERNTYGINLDTDIVLERAEEAIEALSVFQTEVRAFFEQAFKDENSAPGADTPVQSKP